MSELRKAILGRHMKNPITVRQNRFNFDPIKWTEYFDSEKTLETPHGKFHVYLRGTEGPVILCLHGGGYSALSWSLFAVQITSKIECQVLALDIRGHGNTITGDDNDLSLETMAQDVEEVVKAMYGDNIPPMIILGHSMGGALAVQVAKNFSSAVGLCVIDVVEGTALDALSSMQSLLRGRPSMFKSIEHAIQWCYKGGQTSNLEAARVSMPSQIVNMETKQLASNEVGNIIEGKSENKPPLDIETINQNEPTVSSFTIVEEGTEESDDVDKNDLPPLPKKEKSSTGPFKTPINVSTGGPKYCWRIDLSKTEPFWSGWFKGLSQKFLDIPIPKILLLANIHHLDTSLTVGQMQGKFQMQVMNKSGHAIHEDQPEKVADVLAGFLVKQKLTAPKKDFCPPMPCC